MAWVLDDILLGLVDCLGTICGHLYSQDIKRQDHSGVCNRSNICSIHRILFVVLHLWQSWFEPGQTNDSKGSGINRNRVICSFAGISTWNGIFFHCYLPVNYVFHYIIKFRNLCIIHVLVKRGYESLKCEKDSLGSSFGIADSCFTDVRWISSFKEFFYHRSIPIGNYHAACLFLSVKSIKIGRYKRLIKRTKFNL